jgi:hypothetical protein
MLRCLIAGVAAFLFATSAFAEEPASDAPAAANADVRLAAPGDHWTYEVKDEILGTVKLTRTDIVTEVSKSEIAVRFDVANTDRFGSILYDRSWNIVRDGDFRYTPNDGTGMQLPLKVGAQWKFAIEVLNSRNGQTFKRVGTSRVTGHDSITVKAGTFDAFIIETNFTGKNIQDPTLINETSTRTWFNPDVNHWVRRNIVWRQRGHVVRNSTLELIDYGHTGQ